jgi:hypothetical protein
MTNPLDDPLIRTALEASVDVLKAERLSHKEGMDFHAQGLKVADEKLAAVYVLLGIPNPEAPAASASAPLAAAKPRPVLRIVSEPTWTDFIFDQFKGLNTGLTHQELIKRMEGTPFAARFQKSPNAFYARISKLESAGKLKRLGKVIYLPEVLAELESPHYGDEPSDEGQEAPPM